MRGAILPIVDLGALLGLSATVTTKQNVIIVVEASGQVIGLLVDGVSDTLTVTNEMVQPAPPIAAGASIANIGGLVEIEGRLMTLLQLDALDFTRICGCFSNTSEESSEQVTIYPQGRGGKAVRCWGNE